MNAIERNNVYRSDKRGKAIIFAHGFGCDQTIWRFVAPAFGDSHQIVLFDYVGAGASDPSAFTPAKYGTLRGYAEDVLDICRSLELESPVFVGHSVSAIIGVLAAVEEPSRFGELVLIGPSPRYLDDEGYSGGFTRQQIEQMLEFLDHNYLGWSRAMAPVIMGNPDRPELAAELEQRFCRMDPDIAKSFARVTFLSDNRDDLPKVRCRSLVLQCREDVIANESVGRYVHNNMPHSTFLLMEATGHCPNLSAPAETIAAIRAFLRSAA